MKWNVASNYKIMTLAALTSVALITSPVTLAKHYKKHYCKCPQESNVTVYKEMPVPMFVPSWYVGFHLGESRTHDSPAPGSGDSVTQIGPGWTANLGYQFVQFYRATIAAELGYTQYHNSNETLPGINVASTEHFATYLAAVGQYPLVHNFNILGKLGFAYSYAKKVFTGGGSASANDVSLYWGAGFSYNVTQQASLVLQWARVRGNNKTGSTDLTSLGFNYSFL